MEINPVFFDKFAMINIQWIVIILFLSKTLSIETIIFDTMRKVLQSLHNQIQSICRPNSQKYPDPSTHKLIWNRNITNMYICIIFILLCILNASFSNFSSPADTFHIKSNLFVLCIFLLLCRSYLWIFNLLYTTFVALAGFTLLDHIPDAAYVYLGYTFVLLPFIMLRTGEIKLATFIGVLQVFIYLTRFKKKLVILIQEEEPEIFADRLIKTTLFWFLTTILVSFSVIKTLDRRTMELSKAKCALETALENQRTFIFSFSHELRNPINSLLGNLQLVLQGEILSSKATEMIKVARTCGEILLHGINNVLETGKREIGKLEVNPVPSQIHELFQRTWGIYGEILKQKKLENKLKIDQEMPHLVKIDAHKVNQVLLNLIGNSIKFTEQGSITVTCKWLLKPQEVNDECFEPIPYDEEDEGVFEKDENLERCKNSPRPRWKSSLETCRESSDHYGAQEEAKGILKIIVKDTGCGMKKEALEQLFKKFSQVSDNISQRQIGTGLGLFITKEICHTMGGEIRAYSKPGIGATFVVCIPTIALPSDPIRRVDTQEILKDLSAKRLKVIIADDSPFNVNLISDYFSKFGGSVVSKAYNGYEAFVKYRERRSENLDIDIVVLDLDMPVMDGKTACEKIRKYEKENKLKPVIIIFMSGNSGKEQTGESPGRKNRYQADYFLKKPVSFQDFLQSIYYCSNG